MRSGGEVEFEFEMVLVFVNRLWMSWVECEREG